MKQKDIVPGRVIQRMIPEHVDRAQLSKYGRTYIPFMIVGFVVDVRRRRHAKSKAPKIGWQVYALYFGGYFGEVMISVHSLEDWKRLM